MSLKPLSAGFRTVKRFGRKLYLHCLSKKTLQIQRVIHDVQAKHLTYLDQQSLQELAEACLAIERMGLKGIIVEAGCALGGSAMTLASAKSQRRPLAVYDVFGMIPSPSERDGPDVHTRYKVIVSGESSGIGGEIYYGYQDNLYDKVRERFAEVGLDLAAHNITLVKGLYQDTLKIESPVALAHIDCDWYDSVQTCLTRIEPRLVKGGRLVIDDYYAWSGCRAAVDDYFAEQKANTYSFVKKSKLHIVKQ